MYNLLFQKEISAQKGVLLSFILALLGFLFLTTVGFLINYLLFGYITPDPSSQQGLTMIRISQVCQTMGLFIFPAIVIPLLFTKPIGRFLGFNRVSFSLVVISIILMILFIPGINLIASMNAKVPMPSWMIEMERAASRIVKAMLETENVGLFLTNLFVVAIIPAIAEELFFRGLVQKYMIRWTKKAFWGILISATIFSAIHLQFQGFIPRLMLGMLFGYLYFWSGSIWPAIAAHFANNATAVVVYFLIGRGDISSNLDTFGNVNEMWQGGIFSLLVSGLLIWIFWRSRIKHQYLQNSAPTTEDL